MVAFKEWLTAYEAEEGMELEDPIVAFRTVLTDAKALDEVGGDAVKSADILAVLESNNLSTDSLDTVWAKYSSTLNEVFTAEVITPEEKAPETSKPADTKIEGVSDVAKQDVNAFLKSKKLPIWSPPYSDGAGAANIDGMADLVSQIANASGHSPESIKPALVQSRRRLMVKTIEKLTTGENEEDKQKKVMTALLKGLRRGCLRLLRDQNVNIASEFFFDKGTKKYNEVNLRAISKEYADINYETEADIFDTLLTIQADVLKRLAIKHDIQVKMSSVNAFSSTQGSIRTAVKSDPSSLTTALSPEMLQYKASQEKKEEAIEEPKPVLDRLKGGLSLGEWHKKLAETPVELDENDNMLVIKNIQEEDDKSAKAPFQVSGKLEQFLQKKMQEPSDEGAGVDIGDYKGLHTQAEKFSVTPVKLQEHVSPRKPIAKNAWQPTEKDVSRIKVNANSAKSIKAALEPESPELERKLYQGLPSEEGRGLFSGVKKGMTVPRSDAPQKEGTDANIDSENARNILATNKKRLKEVKLRGTSKPSADSSGFKVNGNQFTPVGAMKSPTK